MCDNFSQSLGSILAPAAGLCGSRQGGDFPGHVSVWSDGDVSQPRLHHESLELRDLRRSGLVCVALCLLCVVTLMDPAGHLRNLSF